MALGAERAIDWQDVESNAPEGSAAILLMCVNALSTVMFANAPGAICVAFGAENVNEPG